MNDDTATTGACAPVSAARARLAARACFAACAFALLACGAEAPAGQVLAIRDRAAFESEVLPILIRDCSFPACHGSQTRFFQVFGPGHGRLSAMSKPLDPITADEVERSYQRALSMLDNEAPQRSLLLRKPLTVSAGGAGHRGQDQRGRDVYSSTTDTNFQALERWVVPTTANPHAGEP